MVLLSEHSAALALEQYMTDAGQVAGYKLRHPNRYVEIVKREDFGQGRRTFWKGSKWMERIQMMTLGFSWRWWLRQATNKSIFSTSYSCKQGDGLTCQGPVHFSPVMNGCFNAC